MLVDDDYTFTETGSPHVAGATVDLLDPYDNSQVIATGTTDSTGELSISNVPAGTYVLEVQAAGSFLLRGVVHRHAGVTNAQEVFLENQLVTYSWQVTPTTVADQYTVTLLTTFQTDVPAPVLTISAPPELPTLQPGQAGQFDLTLTNHGMIAAQDVSIAMPTDPEYTLTALSTNVGNIPGGSSVIVPVTVYRAEVGYLDPPLHPGYTGDVLLRLWRRVPPTDRGDHDPCAGSNLRPVSDHPELHWALPTDQHQSRAGRRGRR